MSKFFKPVDFPEEKPKVLDPNPDIEERLDITTILDKIQVEIQAVRDGTSKIHPYAIQMVDGKAAVLVTFNRMKTTPTRANIRTFLAIVEQDISQRIAEHFTSYFQSKYGRI